MKLNKLQQVKSKFITFEGGEGAGKSTQSKLLSEKLQSLGYEVVHTREPGGTTGAEAIRELLVTGETSKWLPQTEMLLHIAARIDHTEKLIKPSLQAGKWVICDRYVDSTIAYQGFGHGLGYQFISNLNSLLLGNFTPDLTFFLDIDVQQGLTRAHDRNTSDENRYEKMNITFHQRLRDGFHFIAKQEPQRFIIINADQSIDKIHETIWDSARNRFFSC